MLDRRGDQKPIYRIAVLKMMRPITAGRCAVAERRGFDTGTSEDALDSPLDGNVEIDPSRIDEQRNS
jgi:hypothetical protein